ncbi:protein translocase SEC61 complex, gamma subunit [Methanosalsum zhilinae DSM 4017]|uniref:Protein translocase subunit SecE n=1 Tax=Methanosalsum zhilinae (strain DSM 4017 / NBRC 107636 / OCM 62 / WeN5) TaxID=679901 RepID=F7XKV1_METZD|nr:protein translocase SEC61 complex subunit gamma [Methanosalsum zhilinae]AEH61818.1 protein translocase SEC61 complex, gamma subunit [Methanosalsum zhilinae DSM 4017]
MANGTFQSDKSKKGIIQSLKTYLRVLKLTKKPSREEFLMISKIAAIGILVVGTIGFIIYLLLTEFPKLV